MYVSVEQTVERLDQVLRVLGQVKQREQFNKEMSSPGSIFDIGVWADKTPDTICGTFACIAGWCALDPWFIHQGFMLAPNMFRVNNGLSVCMLYKDAEHEPQFNWGASALVLFFGIEHDEMVATFVAVGYQQRGEPTSGIGAIEAAIKQVAKLRDKYLWRSSEFRFRLPGGINSHLRHAVEYALNWYYNEGNHPSSEDHEKAQTLIAAAIEFDKRLDEADEIPF